jgi:hypothetical protein
VEYPAPVEGQATSTLVFTERFERQDTTYYSVFTTTECAQDARSGLIAVLQHSIYPTVTSVVRADQRMFLTSERTVSLPGIRTSWCVSQVAFTPQAGATYHIETSWNDWSDSGCAIELKIQSGEPVSDLQVLRPAKSCLGAWAER